MKMYLLNDFPFFSFHKKQTINFSSCFYILFIMELGNDCVFFTLLTL